MLVHLVDVASSAMRVATARFEFIAMTHSVKPSVTPGLCRCIRWSFALVEVTRSLLRTRDPATLHAVMDKLDLEGLLRGSSDVMKGSDLTQLRDLPSPLADLNAVAAFWQGTV